MQMLYFHIYCPIFFFLRTNQQSSTPIPYILLLFPTALLSPTYPHLTFLLHELLQAILPLALTSTHQLSLGRRSCTGIHCCAGKENCR